ncbi:hypothetical protein JHL18_15485 [Clostridium sp. YIM B02505]|uniref:Uncharacterized protein n=1 Tax=Clostridium yunnanense TaxID=2800325 RepID=A0ABS1ERR8_9CLOT|nr:hypothetical protein [Clostridium yunnanense]MBK1812024.1 hypothetical protein [Clostridium yunnanense]
MGLFDIIKKSTKEKKVLDNSAMLSNALHVFQLKDVDIDEELLKIAGHSQEVAEQLYWFFPSILFNTMFPEVKNVNAEVYKVVYSNGEEKDFLYADNKLYKQISIYLKSIYTTLDRDSILNILAHSSEFNAVNNALNDGSKIEDLVVCTVFMSNV